MKVRIGNWFLGKCSNCARKPIMVRKLRGGLICVECAERTIRRAGGGVADECRAARGDAAHGLQETKPAFGSGRAVRGF